MRLTVQPLGVVLQGPLEAVLLPARGQVVEVGPEDDRVGLGELGVRAGVEAGEVAGVAALHPDGGRVVGGVVRALRDAHTDAGDEGRTAQSRQVRLQRGIELIGFVKVFQTFQKRSSGVNCPLQNQKC